MAFLYTIMRNVQADADERPNAFLFASREQPTDDMMRMLLKEASLRKYLPVGKDAFVMRYYKKEDTKYGFLPEWRLVLTSLTHYALPVHDLRDHVSIAWEEPAEPAPLIYVIHWKDLLDNCVELYRVDGCNGCPKKGKECVEQQFGQALQRPPFRPWFMLFGYHRKDEWSRGLSEEGLVNERKERNTEHEFTESYPNLLKQLARLSPLGATFINPKETRLNGTPKMNHPLRSGRDHRFFKDPAHKDEKKTT